MQFLTDHNGNEADTIFFPLLTDLSKHSFSSKNLIQFTKDVRIGGAIKIKTTSKNRQNDSIVKKPKVDMFDPFLFYKDSLFWCFYVLSFGLEKYEMLGNQHFVEEKKIKFQYIEILRSKKDILKMYKIKPLSEIEDDLANKEVIGVKTFISLCIVSNLNVMIIDKHKYYELNMNDAAITHIIYQHTQPLKFVMDLESTKEKVDNYRNTFFQLDSLNYKLKSITSYKIEELLVLCAKLGIKIQNETSNKKITKKVLYDELILHF